MDHGKMPIVVGGTIYYIESIVYKILVEDMDDDQALLWDKSRRKRNFVEYETTDITEAVIPDDDQLGFNPTTSDVKEKDSTEEFNKEQLKEDVDNEAKFTNEEIHAKLKIIDPVMAGRLHPNNRRKVLR